jgi:hypothetical protein
MANKRKIPPETPQTPQRNVRPRRRVDTDTQSPPDNMALLQAQAATAREREAQRQAHLEFIEDNENSTGTTDQYRGAQGRWLDFCERTRPADDRNKYHVTPGR